MGLFKKPKVNEEERKDQEREAAKAKGEAQEVNISKNKKQQPIELTVEELLESAANAEGWYKLATLEALNKINHNLERMRDILERIEMENK